MVQCSGGDAACIGVYTPNNCIALINSPASFLTSSFHVGSGCEDARAFEAAISVSRKVFDQGLQLGFKMTLLDIGGGFPGQKSAPISFREVRCNSMHRVLSDCEMSKDVIHNYYHNGTNTIPLDCNCPKPYTCTITLGLICPLQGWIVTALSLILTASAYYML